MLMSGRKDGQLGDDYKPEMFFSNPIVRSDSSAFGGSPKEIDDPVSLECTPELVDLAVAWQMLAFE